MAVGAGGHRVLPAAVVGALAGQVQVGVLQRGVPGHQFVHGDAVPGGQVADGGGVQAGNRQRAAVLRGDRRAPRGEQRGEVGRPGRAHQHVAARAGLDELGRGHVGDQPAAADDDQVVGGQRHLAHQVAGHEDGAALGGQRLEELADPVDAFGVQAVDRLVEHQHRRVAEQRGGDAEPLLHAEREPSTRAAATAVQPGQLSTSVTRRLRRSRCSARGQQVVPGGAPAVQRARVEQRPDLVQRAG